MFVERGSYGRWLFAAWNKPPGRRSMESAQYYVGHALLDKIKKYISCVVVL